MSDTQEEFLRVGGGTPANDLATVIALAIEQNGEVRLRSIGAGATNQAIKALTIARGAVAQQGEDLWYTSGFRNIVGQDGARISAMVFHAQLKK